MDRSGWSLPVKSLFPLTSANFDSQIGLQAAFWVARHPYAAKRTKVSIDICYWFLETKRSPVHYRPRQIPIGSTMIQGRILKSVAAFITEEEGATAVEYAVMLALIIAVCAASVTTLANTTRDSFDSSGNAISGAIGN